MEIDENTTNSKRDSQTSDKLKDDFNNEIGKETNEEDDSYLIEDSDNDTDFLEDDFDSTKEKNKLKPKKNNRSLGNIIRYIIMTAAAIVFLYSGFMLAKIYLEYKQGNDIYKSIANSVIKPLEKNTTDSEDDSQQPFKYDHQALLNINSEGVGYLYVPAIPNLLLPIVQGTDNDYYLTHTFNRTYNGAGALFEDYRITNGLAATHVIIYGHNMKNGSMFAGLSKYLTPSFYKTQGNDVFYIYTEHKVMQYKIFSAYISDPISDTYNFNFSSLSAMRDYAESMKQLSAYNTGVDVSKTSQVITLSTCTGDGEQRIIVQGTFVSESPLE